jgi:hypothetical protein
MGNEAMKSGLDPRHFKLDCGFYVYEGGFRPQYRPVVLEVKTERGDRTHRYRWKYGAKKGDLVYNMATPNRRMFTDILHILGFRHANESDLRNGSIAMANGSLRDILAYVPNPAHSQEEVDQDYEWYLTYYVDEGLLQPLEFKTRYRSLFPDPVTGEQRTHSKSAVHYKGKNVGDIIYPRDAPARDVFKLALRKIGYRSMRERRFKTGTISVGKSNHPFVAYKP